MNLRKGRSPCVCLSCRRSGGCGGSWALLMARSLHPEATAVSPHWETAGANQLSLPWPLTGDFQRDVNLETGSGNHSNRSCFLGHTLKPSANQEVTAGHRRPIGHAVRQQTDQLQAGLPQGRSRHVLAEGSRGTFFSLQRTCKLWATWERLAVLNTRNTFQTKTHSYRNGCNRCRIPFPSLKKKSRLCCSFSVQLWFSLARLLNCVWQHE